jgi:AcrR family transcriptional regulator
MDYVISLGRRQRKRQAVHQQLLDAAERLFSERGVARTTVDDIAEAADVARQTFFNHFPYKEALAVELEADGVQEVAQHAQALLEAGMPALEVLQRTAEWVLERSIEDGELAVVVARELLHPDPERARRAAEQIPLREIFEGILVQAREEGTLRGDLPVQVVAARLSSVLRSIISQILLYDAEQLRRELAVCFDIVFNGIVDRST